MGRATRTELLWAYAITREEFLKRVNDKFELHPEEWENIRDTLFDAMSKGESPMHFWNRQYTNICIRWMNLYR